MVPVETHLRQRDMSYFWDFGKNLRIKFVKQITSQLEWKIWWVLEVNQKKRRKIIMNVQKFIIFFYQTLLKINFELAFHFVWL